MRCLPDEPERQLDHLWELVGGRPIVHPVLLAIIPKLEFHLVHAPGQHQRVIPFVLVHLHQARFDGTLRVTQQGSVKLLFFQRGEIAMASSNESRDHLAPILIREGKLKNEQLDLARKSAKPGTSLARVLVQMGFLTSGELFAGARQQLRQIVGSLLCLTDAQYSLEKDHFPREITSLNVDTREMILDLVRKITERTFILSEVGSPDTRWEPVPAFPEMLAALRPPNPWKELADRAAPRPDDVAFAVENMYPVRIRGREFVPYHPDWDPTRAGAGASGAVFGIAGVLISFFYFAKLDLPKERIKSILGWVTRFAVINLAFGFSLRLAGIDIIGNAAHLGGLITGLLLGVFFARTYSAPAEERFGRQLRILAGAAVLLVALFPPIIKAEKPRLESFYGEIALQRADYTAAIAHFQKALAQSPDDAIIHGALGYALAGSRRYDEAMGEYKRALALQPGFPWVEVNMAATYLAQGQPGTAVELFKKNMGKTTWESEDYRYYGDALMQTGDLNGAEAALLQAIKLDPKDARPHQLLAQVYTKLGKTADAEREAKFGSSR